MRTRNSYILWHQCKEGGQSSYMHNISTAVIQQVHLEIEPNNADAPANRAGASANRAGASSNRAGVPSMFILLNCFSTAPLNMFQRDHQCKHSTAVSMKHLYVNTHILTHTWNKCTYKQAHPHCKDRHTRAL